jgi:mannan endo-1,4-beta-mannosidase
VKRYANSPSIFAWELGNEPRCGADATRNLPRSPTGCNVKVVTKWIDDMSTFIKSLDPFHMVTAGDEGFFNDANPADPSDWAYTGADGVDFVANLKLKNIDFGTFHLYPDWWSKSVEWATAFVQRHAKEQENIGKPVVMEEVCHPLIDTLVF